jgi:hypothetical protein
MTHMATEVCFPSASDILLDPDYEPLEHLLPECRKNNIAEIPGHPDLLLRWFPYDEETAKSIKHRFQAAPNPEILQSISDTCAEHLRIVEEGCGIAVVPHTSEVAPISTATWQGDSLVTVVQRLTGQSLDNRPDLGNELPAQLLDYLGRTVNRTVILSDIYAARQFTATREEGAQRVILHDIEPRLIPRSMRSHILNSPEFRAWQKRSMGHYWNER